MRDRTNWKIAAMIIAATLCFGIAFMIPQEPCKPGDIGAYIGGAILIAGCPERSR